jgi:hypothetical protein
MPDRSTIAMDDITKLNDHIVSGQGRYRLDRCEIDAGWSLKVLESIRIERDTALAERQNLQEQLDSCKRVQGAAATVLSREAQGRGLAEAKLRAAEADRDRYKEALQKITEINPKEVAWKFSRWELFDEINDMARLALRKETEEGE